ncbi:MAG: NB-ARC domain-containing protein, partial [Cyanobacteria bacterium P01_H01_bin.130]
SLEEEQLVNVFANDPQEFAQYRVLEREEWREVVTWLFQRGCEERVLFPSGSLEEDFGDVIDALAGELEGNFQKNLREVLKDDAANGGEAFAGMLLDLHGATLAQIAELKQALNGLATREDICRLLQAIEKLSQPKRDPSDEVGPGAVDTVPKLPPHFLPREEDLQELKGRLLTPATQTVVMTGRPRKVGLQGMGGIGKTVLAAAVARDTEVRQRFRHGVIWLTVGIEPKPIELYQRVATTLGESYAYQEGDAQWNAYLSNLLREKSCLLVLDDVWEQREAERFVEILGEDCRLLLTTRDARLIAGLGAEEYRVEMLAEEQARLLLANWAGLDVEMLPLEAAAVVKHCGRLPLALALSGAQVKAGTSWGDLVAALDAADLKFLDHPHGSIYKSLEASVGALDERLRRACLELGLVAPDVQVSETALVKLWGREGDVPDYQVRRWVTEFAQRALVFVTGESPDRWVSLHNVQQKYLQENLQNTTVLHQEWLRAYGGGNFPWSGAEVEGEVYLYRQAAYHFKAAGEEEAFRQLLWDFDWLQQKLVATDIDRVLVDFAALSCPDPFLNRLERTLRLSAHVLNQDKSQLASQLWGRLLDPKKIKQRLGYRYFWQKIPIVGPYLPQYPSRGPVEQLLRQARARQEGLWFRPLVPCLDSPDGALIRTFTGHNRGITAVAIAPDGKRGLSGSVDGTLKLWDLDSGRELCTFIGHSDEVKAVAIAPDGKRALSGSSDNTLKLWDLDLGGELSTFIGHSREVLAVAIAPDGKRALSGSKDNTLKLWDLDSVRELRTFIGHSDEVKAIAIAPDGKR